MNEPSSDEVLWAIGRVQEAGSAPFKAAPTAMAGTATGRSRLRVGLKVHAAVFAAKPVGSMRLPLAHVNAGLDHLQKADEAEQHGDSEMARFHQGTAVHHINQLPGFSAD